MPIDLEALNEPQREAVLCTEGPLLVLAGAGSGKTRVLTHRIAHLVVDLGVAPWQIMAITFTNKAAAEMRERLGQLMGGYVRGMWVSTFHSMCVRILRSDCERLGFAPGFTIYDDSDSKSLVKRIMAELNIDPKRYPESMVRNRISKAKNELVTPEVFEDRYKDPTAQVVGRIYKVLQERLRALNAFDFDDLLLYTCLLYTSPAQKRERILHEFGSLPTGEEQHERQHARDHRRVYDRAPWDRHLRVFAVFRAQRIILSKHHEPHAIDEHRQHHHVDARVDDRLAAQDRAHHGKPQKARVVADRDELVHHALALRNAQHHHQEPADQQK